MLTLAGRGHAADHEWPHATRSMRLGRVRGGRAHALVPATFQGIIEVGGQAAPGDSQILPETVERGQVWR
jgi:hypothetical protein